jgi:hypothetical protein
MRLVRLEEYRLSWLQAADVEDEGTEDSDISREVAVEGLDEFALRLVESSAVLLNPLDELPNLLLDELIVRLHECREELLEASLLVLLGCGAGRGEFRMERGGDGGTDNSGEFGCRTEEGGDLGRGTEAAETREVGEGNGHLRLQGEEKGKSVGGRKGGTEKGGPCG